MNKRAKLLLAVLLIAAGGALAFVGAAPTAYKTVSDLTAEPATFDGARVEVKATVMPGTLNATADPLRFTIRDDRASLPVLWTSAKPVPEHETAGSIEGRTVVITGTLVQGEDGAWVLHAEDMQVGCASKYEPA